MVTRVVLGMAAVAAALGVTPAALAWSWPTDGRVLRPFAFGENPYAAGLHRGVDVAGDPGTSVRAPTGGTVAFAGTVPGGGRSVTIETPAGYHRNRGDVMTISAMSSGLAGLQRATQKFET